MPLDAPTTAGDPSGPRPPRGTADAFRMLTARLKRPVPAPAPDAPREAAPGPSVPPPPPPPVATSPGDAAGALLDIIWGALDLPPQERSLAGDTLLFLLPRLPARELTMLAERVAAMDAPPPLLLSRLARDPRPEIGGVVLERSPNLNDEDLIAAASGAAPDRLRLVARRRRVSTVLGDHLVQSGELLTLLALLRNPGADISLPSFLRLSVMAGEHPGLQAPLALRTDLPLAAALELFWQLPPELRRVILSRFLSDSVTLGRILSIAMAVDSPAGEAPPQTSLEAALAPLLAGDGAAATRRFAALAGIAEDTARRILADGDGEALVALFKALGMSRARLEQVLDHLRHPSDGMRKQERAVEDLKAVFDALSFNKARVLLIYWDWFTRKAGPYAPLS